MRVLVLSTDWNVFNEESAVARRFRLQASTIDRLDVFVPHGPSQTVQLAGNATMRGFGPGRVRGALRMLLSARSVPRPDIVSVQDPFLIGLLGWVVARARGSQLHVQVHTDVFHPNFAAHSVGNRLKVRLAKFMLRRADGIRVVSERIKRSMEPLRLRASISVLPVFIDTNTIKDAQALDRRVRYPLFQKIVLVVSRLESEKDVSLALRTFRDVHATEPSAGLVIVGAGSLRSALAEEARTLGLEKWVVFEGAQNPFPFYKAADVLLLTSHFEGYGMVIVEALAAGCPVVSLDVGIAGEAGAVVTEQEKLAETALMIMRKGARAQLAFSLPSESEYRDLWRTQIMVGSATDKNFYMKRDANTTLRIGFIGQGFIGKNYADDFERRGFTVVRYALEEPYRANKEKIKDCDIVFIAVPTPTTPQGFDDSIVRGAVALVGKGKTVIIKSTVLPGTTASIQAEYTILSGALQSQLGTATSFNADDRTNQVILVSDPRQVPFFDDLIARLDVKSDPNTRNEVIYLKHAAAKDVASILSQLVAGQNNAARTAGADGSGRPLAVTAAMQQPENGAQQPPPGTPPTPTPGATVVDTGLTLEPSNQFSSLLTILPEERSNSIVISGTVDDLRLINDLVEKIDVLLAQVRIEVVIAEVTLSDGATSGITALGLTVIDSKLAGFTVSGPGYNVPQAVFAPGNSLDLSGTINLVTTPRKSNATILSQPNIITTHNKEGKIFVGEQRPVISSYLNDATNVGAIGTGYRSTVSSKDIGIQLSVKPLIGNDGSVQLEITQEVNDILGDITIDGNPQPRIGRRSTQSFVSVKSGEIIVLGGLQRTSKSKSTSRLGPIPIIGDLFGARSRDDTRTDLVFFLRPTVLTNTPADNVPAMNHVEQLPPEQRDRIKEALKPVPTITIPDSR